MLLHDADAEKPFEASFDARFPYDDAAAASSLIHQGWAISLNAAFCILEELCRPPKSASVGKERLRELVSEWAKGPDHPLKLPVLHAARDLIDGTPFPWREGVELMRQVGQYEGQRSALNVAYFASDSASREGDRALERTYREICEKWEANRV